MMLTDRLRFAFEWLPRCKNLLDVGGDFGSVSNEYLKKSKNVFMIDYNEEHLIQGRNKFPAVKFVRGASEYLPFKSNFFDAVAMTDTLEHVQDEKKTIKEVSRVMKKEGALILSVPHKGIFGWIDVFNLKFIFPFFYKWLKGKEFAEEQLALNSWHRHYSLKELICLLKDDFMVEKVHRAGLIYPFLWLFNDLFIVHALKDKKPLWLDKLLSKLYDLDYSIDLGSAGYHIILKLRKI